jgi:hypothetical protein
MMSVSSRLASKASAGLAGDRLESERLDAGKSDHVVYYPVLGPDYSRRMETGP